MEKSRFFKPAIVTIIILVSVYFLAHLAAVPLATVFDKSKPTGETPSDWGYKYSEVAIREPGFSRATVWYIETGEPKGQILLLAHNGGNKSVPLMRWTAGILLDHGYNVALADPRGQGESGGIKTYGAGEAIDASRIVDRLAEEHPGLPVGGLGYSLGAATLIRAMGLNRRLGAVAAFAPYSRMDGDLIRQEIEYQTGGRWSGQGILPGFLAFGFRLLSFSFRRIPQPIEVAASLEDRSLLTMHFRSDPELPVRYSEELFSVAGETVYLHVYEGDGHVPRRRTIFFEKDYADRIVGFFDRRLQQGG